MSDEQVELKAKVKGNVQGVFFRATVKEHASHFEITGYAKNLEDGSVEIVAQGKKTELIDFIRRIKKNPGKGKLEDISYSFHSVEGTLKGFQIL